MNTIKIDEDKLEHLSEYHGEVRGKYYQEGMDVWLDDDLVETFEKITEEEYYEDTIDIPESDIIKNEA